MGKSSTPLRSINTGGSIMNAFRMKKIQTLLFSIMVTLVLSAGTLSARQLSLNFQTNTCSGTCSMTRPCISATNKCVCSFTTPLTGFCTTKLAGAVPAGK
jgi:hypothetical protein